MVPVFQTTKTNCLTAAIASVLSLPISECPELWDYVGDEWLRRLREWARSKGLGLVYMNIVNRQEWPIMDGFYCIVVGTTSRSAEYRHSVVARAACDFENTRLEFVHDPCEGGDFITDPEYMIAFIPQTPAVPR